MTSPNPRSKLLPARGNKADLEFWIEDILEGEMVYAYDEDQYYQKEGGLLVAVGATKTQGSLADSALQDAPNDAKQYGRSGGQWVEIDTTDTGAVGEGLAGEFPYYDADGRILSSAGSRITVNTVLDRVEIPSVSVDDFNLNGTFTVEDLAINGTGPARLSSGSDLILDATGDIDADSNVIKNLADPVDDQDATTKVYVTAAIAAATAANPINKYTFDGSVGSYWIVTGPGLPSAGTIDPDIVLYKGMIYDFEQINNEADTRRLYIKTLISLGNSNLFDDTGEWVTGDPLRTQRFEVPFSAAQVSLFYCSDISTSASGELFIRPES